MRIRRRAREITTGWRVLAVVTVLATALTGCGGAAGDDGGAPQEGNKVGITVDDAGFRTPAIAPSGATFAVNNRGEEAHTFTADDGSWDTGEIQPGETVEIVIEETGSVPYHCELHPDGHRGTISLFSDD